MAKKLPKAKKGWEWRPLEAKGKPEKELDYYDCPFSTDIELEDFSKEFLIKLMKIWRDWYMGMVLTWYAGISDRFGSKPADELLIKVLVDFPKQEMPIYIPLLGPNYKSVDDLKTLEDSLKIAVLPPEGTIDKTLFGGTLEWKNDKHAISTVTHCALLEYFESIDQLGPLQTLCTVTEQKGTEVYFINPKIKVSSIKIPPRKDPNEPCCIWEYRMMDKPQPRRVGRREEGKMAKEVPQAKKGWDWRPLEAKGKPEKELDYYDCPFSTDIELEDFSKEFLIKLMKIWRKWYLSMVLTWYAGVSERFGPKAADEFLTKVWIDLPNATMPKYIPLLGPNYKQSLDDLKTLEDSLKIAVLPPDGTIDKTLFGGTLEWKNDKHAMATVTHCALLEYFESIDQLGPLQALCKVTEQKGTEAYFANPNIKVTRIKVPPRKDPNESCCIWDYQMTDTPQR